MKNKISVVRKSTESVIRVTIEKGNLRSDYRKHICTPLPFLNHMIEHIAWRAALNIDIHMEFDEFKLVHLVTEDVSMTLGRAVGEFVRINTPSGYGSGIGIIDEAKAEAVLSFEDRSLFDFHSAITYDSAVEGMPSEELITFLDGFAQGARCTLHIDIEKGVNGHHIWEAVYRAFGIALGKALAIDAAREGMTSGVAGQVSYEITAE
ncbi:imidazoleglycerol-phosphate dehydratase [Ructibacterium gallinarum]|uniref:Imidazoleglycerol-phosphate dehydratase n=1 Tax=Ructibacterium gallinarum TaxID=2779355 RepID=A0A9D5M424_9FIRM|nr:hypothetical protein [Ructibacterium gallinarum]MBE5040319.1 hypothetical protein [Ructibacterium gallinarum]